jgi:hypothetical protein
VSVEDRDLVLSQQIRDAVRQLLSYRARPCHHFSGIEADVLGGESEIVEPVQQMVNFRAAQQRLGRNAAPVQADAAEIGFFHDRGLEPELRRADRRDIAAGTGADDDEIVGHAQSNQLARSL